MVSMQISQNLAAAMSSGRVQEVQILIYSAARALGERRVTASDASEVSTSCSQCPPKGPSNLTETLEVECSGCWVGMA